MAINYDPSFMNIVAVDTYSNHTLKVSIDEFMSDILDEKLTIINQRLAILEDPTPEKLEKYAALKKAYEHYKLVEKLLNDD